MANNPSPLGRLLSLPERVVAASAPGRRMKRSLTPARRLATIARWPVGILLTSYRYLWRTTPTRRGEEPGSLPEDQPPELPEGTDCEDLQLVPEGAGPMFHRIFRIAMRESEVTAEELMRRIQADVNVVAPGEFAYFGKVCGEDEVMQTGDEYIVRMPGPWDGPVRVVEAGATSFRLVTLTGHLEAGQILFRAWEEDGRLHFGIDTWARSGDRFSNLLYHHLRFSKEVQLHMWTSFLEKVEDLSGGRRDGLMLAWTRRLDESETDNIGASQNRQIEAIRAG